jgi:tRNA(Ile)-lysidine synthase
VLDRVVETISRYAMFQPGQRVGVAVSGGADSACLLHILLELSPRWNLRLFVLHLDHQLRGEESREDARFVARMAQRLGLEAHIEQANLDLRGENLEQAARGARRAYFLKFLESGEADRVALGHTRSDQAETVVFRFLRGSGTAGLAGIRPISPEGMVRPLLAVTREDVEHYLTSRAIPWREDATNFSLEFARNRIRHDLLPALARQWNPALASTLAQTADWAFEEERYWEREIGRLAGLYLTLRPPAVLLRADRLWELPRAVARRLVRRAIELTNGDMRGIDFCHVDAVLRLGASVEGSGRLQLPGLDVYRSFDWIRVSPLRKGSSEGRLLSVPVEVPGSARLPGAGSTVGFEILGPDSGYTGRMRHLDWERISVPLELRNWRPGDQYRPFGSAREEKIKTLFQESRVPLWERRYWPVVTSGSSIIWTRRFGPSSDFAATEGTRVVLAIREIDNVES